MTSKYPVVDLANLQTMSIGDRKSKVDVVDFATPHSAGAEIGEFLERLPNIFAGRWIRNVIDRVVTARSTDKPFVVTMGAHVIKCGLSPILCDLMRKGVITAIAMNGAGAIHDSEIARYGVTSEDVVEGMRTGMFGMASETADFLNGCAKTASDQGLGFGEALGRRLIEENAQNRPESIMATAYECDVPLSIHACIGCDIVHMHSSADGTAIGAASLRDFRVLTEAMKNLGGGGVLANFGSAVVLPEVVLKAITILINLGADMKGMTGVNFDFVQHYRSNTQIVARVREIGGEGICLTGHHELMIPLLAAGIIERLEK